MSLCPPDLILPRVLGDWGDEELARSLAYAERHDRILGAPYKPISGQMGVASFAAVC